MGERMNLTTLMDLASLCDCMKEEVERAKQPKVTTNLGDLRAGGLKIRHSNRDRMEISHR